MAPPDRHIVLLMKPPETRFFSEEISKIAPSTTLYPVHDAAALRRVTSRAPETARLIAFSTAIIVPPEILGHFRYNCYNFHPGPPEFPGNRPSAFALYAGATRFGVTLHQMHDKVDAGPIIAVSRFAVGNVEDAQALAVEAYKQLARLFLRNLTTLVRTEMPPMPLPIAWSGEKGTMAKYDSLRRIEGSLDGEELARRMRCFDGIYCPLI